jgi:superfamily II DNA or RNA helicase
VAYKLEQPGHSEETEGMEGVWYLRFMLQANDNPDILVDARDLWMSSGTEYEVDECTFVHPHESLLQSLAEAARIFPPIARALEAVEKPCGVAVSTEEAWHFIAQVAHILHQFGVSVLVPKELRAGGQQRLRLRLHVGSSDGWGKKRSKVGIHGLTDFRWQVALGNEDLTPEQFKEIASMKEPLVQWRGQWMAVDPKDLARMEALFDNADTTGEIDRTAALAAALTGSVTGVGGSGRIDVVAQGEINDLVSALKDADSFEEIDTPKGFHGTLRPYQERGLTWLSHMTDLGFGVCLADDMGLGKTIQVIAMFLAQKESGTWGDAPAVLVCPTSVLGNWERELNRFAPSLNVIRHHGRNRAETLEELQEQAEPGDVILTTYVIARMDVDIFSAATWSHIIIDEAQNIKNPKAQQAIAIRKIPAARKVALTGTPIENRLMELWSILEFANPGLLGNASDFRRRFALPIERFGDKKVADNLRRMVNPFILRRVKTDPKVIQDLPEKQEYKVYCTLTREQASLYQAAVESSLEEIEGSTGVKRRGNILALLTGLKQICNHPVHYLKEEEGTVEKLTERSGKLTRVTEMLEEVIAEEEHALVFTQYTEMGKLLQRHFEEQFGFTSPFIHGGVPANKRDDIVSTFQEDPDALPILLLSLKAGGTGLNLTRATHVFHFDRWWNPAVEDQATDRAYRVGQTQNVQVHKMLCSGTVEEKIDDILESKRDLADQIVGTGESWITELDDGELRDLFSLGNTVTIDDDVESDS